MVSYIGRISIEHRKDNIEAVRLTIEGNSSVIEFTLDDHLYNDLRIVKGVFNGLGDVTLIDCDIVSSEAGSGGIIRKYKAKYTLINIQLSNPDDYYFDSATITIPSVLTWTGFHSVSLKSEEGLSRNLLLKIPEELVIYKGDLFTIKVFGGYSFSYKREHSRRTIDEFSGFKILSTKANRMNIWEYLKYFKELQKVLLILANKKSNIASVKFYKKDVKIPVDFKSQEIVFLGEPSVFGSKIDFQAIKSNLQSICESWFKNSEIHTSMDLILEKSVYNISRENFFLNNCFAIEIFHRRFKNYKLFGKSEFKSFKQKLLANIEKDDKYKLVENSLAHINEPNFRARLSDFSKEFEIVLEDVWEYRSFINKTVKTRNYLVHRSSDKDVFEKDEMLLASYVLESITKYSIFKILTIEDNICDQYLMTTGNLIRKWSSKMMV